jgi:hypothetical protein
MLSKPVNILSKMFEQADEDDDVDVDDEKGGASGDAEKPEDEDK